MRIPRIYQPGHLASGAAIELEPQAAAHVTRVLRLKVGAPVTLFNGEGGEYPAHLERLDKRAAVVRLEQHIARDAESPLQVVLAQGISRGERMDYTIQKAVELGVTAIVPLLTERAVVNLKGERADKRCQHWQSVVASACEQSGRNRVPVVEPIQDFAAWLAQGRGATRLLLHHQGSQSLAGLAAPEGLIVLLVGPEGGLSEQERAQALGTGYSAVRMGPRVLRTETAALAALAIMQAQWGDFRA